MIETENDRNFLDPSMSALWLRQLRSSCSLLVNSYMTKLNFWDRLCNSMYININK